VTVVYTSVEGSGNILYKETPTSAISLSGPSTVLMPGGLNDATSTKQNIAGSVVILAGSGSSLSGVLRSGGGFTIAASAGSGGTITPSGDVIVSSGGSQGFTIAANSGYHIADVLVDAVSVGAVGSYTFNSVSANHTIAASFAPDSPGADLLGWWKMDGDVTDASSYGNHATAFGSPTYVAGFSGQALNLNGGSQYAAVPDNAALRIPTNALTLATWVKPTLEATQNLISKSTNGGIGGYELCLAATSSTWPHKAFFRLNQVSSGDTYRINSTTLYSDHLNTWIHLAATYDGATMKLYVNGVLESSLPAAITINQNTLPVGLGAQVDASNAGTRFFAGAMDDSRIYNRALSASEIAALAGSSPTTHTIAASAGTGGSIGPSGAVTVSDGASQVFTITPASCYTIADVLVDGLSVGVVASYTFTNVVADHTIAASFAASPTFTITASSGPNGSISPSGAVSVACGASQAFGISANGGYHVADVLVDGGSVGAVTGYTFTNLQAPHTIAASFALDAPAGDLVGHWRMDEGSGSLVADDSPNGLHGTAVGSPAWVPGVQGPWALSFTNGTSKYVTVPNAGPLNITAAITMAAWIRPTQVATASIINKATFATGPVFGYELDLSTTGVPFVRLFNDTQAPGGGRLNATVPYPTNGTTWMHVAATYDGATISMYVNGVLNVTRASTAPITTNSLPFVIGAPSDGLAARVFPGAIDDVRLYNRALTGAEIAALANLTPTHTITASAGTGGSISPSGAVVVNEGADQAFTIAPSTGYHIADVLVDAVSVGPVASYTFTNVVAPHTIAASFAIDVLTITATAGTGGDISPSGSVPVNYGADQTFAITPATCYAIADVLVDGSSVGAVPSYTFNGVTVAHSIAASFALQTFTITASAGPNGSISPSGPQVVDCGTDHTFTVTADPGYHIADVQADGGSVGAVASHTFTNVQASHTISATFAPDATPTDLVGWWPFEEGSGTALLDASGKGHDGTLPNGAAWAAGVEGLALGLNGSNQRGTVPDSPTLGITGAITLATWVKPQRMATQHLIHKGSNGAQDGYEISLAQAPPGASGRPFVRFNQLTRGNLFRLDGSQLYPFDGNTWFHLAATYDGTTIKLYVNGVLDSSKVATFTIGTNSQPLAIGSESDGQFMLQGSMDEARVYSRALSATEIAALAHLLPTTHTITASAGSGGVIAPSGAVTVSHGANATFTITPASCYTIADVLVDGLSVGPVASHTFTNVIGDHTIAASFVPRPPFTIAASAGTGGSISPSGVVVADCGMDKTFTISADPGYTIADVLVDGISVGAVASHTFSDVQAGHTIEASFAWTGADKIAAVPTSGTAITLSTPCLVVPVVFTRADATPVRGYSVTLELSPNLTLCGAQIVSGGYPLEPRNLQVTPQGGNRWKVDEVTLGYPCGVTGSATLFNVSVTSSETFGSGTITVVSALARDCSNVPVPASPGALATIAIDRTGQVGVGDPPRSNELSLASPAPNPASNDVLVRFTLPREADVSLAAFDLAGRKLADLERAWLPAGEHRVMWNFRDASGRELAAGYYILKLRVDDRVLTQRGIRVR
jgi:hypothetical protein